jgi:carboxyl-terminal processing protease
LHCATARKKKALDIENKRRKALGEELLTSLDLDDDENAETDQHDDVAASDDGDEDEDEDDDVLLIEAGNVLVDVLLLKKQSYALRNAD